MWRLTVATLPQYFRAMPTLFATPGGLGLVNTSGARGGARQSRQQRLSAGASLRHVIRMTCHIGVNLVFKFLPKIAEHQSQIVSVQRPDVFDLSGFGLC